MKLIDKSALVAEIENLENTYKKCPTCNIYEDGLKEGRLIGYKDALHKITSLKFKEVNLDEEIDKIWKTCNPIDEGMGCAYIDIIEFDIIAKHFFELGLQAQREEQ